MLIFKKCNSIIFFAVHVNKYSKSVNSNLENLLKNMPKDRKHVMESQSQRKKLKEKYSKYAPGRISLQVLGTGAEGAPRSLYVFTDQSRYLFNCGEGTQRLAHEHKMKLAKLEHVFVTHKSWKNIGGLPGAALTIQDVGVPQITLHGPKGLEEIFTATKRFVILRDLHIETADCEVGNEFYDNVMAVSYVPIVKEAYLKTDDSFNEEEEMESDDPSYSENLTKGIQAKSDLSDVSTSTRRERSRNRHARNSKSPHRSPSNETIYDCVVDNVDYYAHERKPPEYNFKSRSRSLSVSGRRNIPDKESDIARLNKLRNMKDKGTVMCYICKVHPRPGALNPSKCIKMGVQSGALYGKLKMGQDVTLANGVIVKSSDVCEPEEPGPIFIVVECPTEDYVNPLTNNTAFFKHQGLAKPENVAFVVVHFTPQHIIDDTRYQQWMNKFSKSTQHLILNESNTCMGSIAVHRAQYKLNMLHPTIFPLLGDKGSKMEDLTDTGMALKKIKMDSPSPALVVEDVIEANDKLKTTANNIIYPNTFSMCHLRPKTGMDRSSELKLVPSEYILEPNKVEGFSDVLKSLKTELEKYKNLSNNKRYPRILFLGTGSCIPNKTRNTSGILVELSENTSILMDCGEGTYGQLVRFFGPDHVDQALSKIKGIFVSHLHADHHIGLIGLLQGRRQAIKKLKLLSVFPVLLIAPKQILTWLNFYDRYFEGICKEFELIANADLNYDDPTLFEGTRMRIFQTLELCDISTAQVRHCPNAFGIAFSHRSGYKVCYSGDTMPAENLINIGQNCDLLIHEATMEDELEHEALSKMHSTTSQAIEVGRNMNASNILLTHFSQRYAKLPRFNDNFRENIGIAFDNMHISFDLLPVIPLLYPAMKLMFAEHYEELENKAIKRQLRVDSPDSSEPSKCRPQISSPARTSAAK